MQRAVVVAAVGGEHRQAVGVVPGAHQVVAGGLAGRVGAVGLEAVRFGEGRCVGCQAAVDLVGAHVQEAERGLLVSRKRRPMRTHRFEQAEGADDVGLNEVFGAMNGAVHMALGGEVDDRAGPVLGQQPGHQRTVADVALHEHMACIALQAGQVFQVARVGEFVEIDDGFGRLGKPVEHEVAADEAGAASDENHETTLKVAILGQPGSCREPRIIFTNLLFPADQPGESVSV